MLMLSGRTWVQTKASAMKKQISVDATVKCVVIIIENLEGCDTHHPLGALIVPTFDLLALRKR